MQYRFRNQTPLLLAFLSLAAFTQWYESINHIICYICVFSGGFSLQPVSTPVTNSNVSCFNYVKKYFSHVHNIWYVHFCKPPTSLILNLFSLLFCNSVFLVANSVFRTFTCFLSKHCSNFLSSRSLPFVKSLGKSVPSMFLHLSFQTDCYRYRSF